MSGVLITGAAGYLGRQLVSALAGAGGRYGPVLALDVRAVSAARSMPGIGYGVADVRASALMEWMGRAAPDVVVHLASIVTPGRRSNRALEYAVDVGGTANVLAACRETGVRRIVITSSGAAYGYHADNPVPITEDQPLRGNEAFAYSYHKRLVEEMLAQWRVEHPALEQVVFRVGTILGESTDNQITALFERRHLLAVRGATSPFVFAWDGDVVGCILRALDSGPAGIYNVAGDGTLTIQEIGAMLGRPCLEVPAALLRVGLAFLRPLRLTRYGPEQVGFLQYRPVLDNTRLKREFGYVPRLTTRQTFERWAGARGLRGA